MKEKIQQYYTFITIFFILVLAALSLFLYRARQETFELLADQYNEQQGLLAKQTALGLEENIAIVVRELDLLTNMCAVKTVDLDDIQTAMASTYGYVNRHHVDDIWYINQHGTFLSALKNRQLLQQDFSNRDFFKRSAAQDEGSPVFEFISLPGKNRGEQGIAVAMPIYTNENLFGGVMLFFIRLPGMIESKSPSFSVNNRTWVVDEKGAIVYHPDYRTGTDIGSLHQIDGSLAKFIRNAQNSSRLEGKYLSETGMENLVATYPARIADHKWFVVISTPASSISPLLFRLNFMYAFLTIGAITAIICGSLLVIFMINKWNSALQKENTVRVQAEMELQKAHDELEQRI